MSSSCHFLGHAYDWAGMKASGRATFGVKTSTVLKTIRLIKHHLKTRTMTPGEASKLRGIVMWLDTGLMGRPCRGALTALVARQYWEWAPQHELTHNLSTALHYIHLAAATIPPRVIPIAVHGRSNARTRPAHRYPPCGAGQNAYLLHI